MDTATETALKRLIDKDLITDLVHSYSYANDHRLHDQVVELFTEDCVVDFAPGYPPLTSKAALRQMLTYPEGGFAATSHHNANIFVTFDDDDHASVRTSVYAWHQRKDGSTPQLWGYYYDSVVRLAEGWRISARQLRMLGAQDWDLVMHPDV